MAQIGYILCKQGGKTFDGTSNRTGHPKGSTILYSLRTAVDTPVDLDHMAMTGKRHHELALAEIAVDTSSYQYFQAVIDKDRDGTQKLDVELALFRPNQDNIGLWGAGDAQPYYTVHLVDAVLGDIDFVMNARESGRGQELQTDRLFLKFTYRQIEWTFKQGNKTTQDAWNPT